MPIFSEINSFISLWERLKRWRGNCDQEPLQSESIVDRFVFLFEKHNVHRNEIPRFFNHGLTIKHVNDSRELLGVLDEKMLDDACKLFGVRREWLDGVEGRIYKCHDFYKDPASSKDFFKSVKESCGYSSLNAYLISPLQAEGQALLLIQEPIGVVGDKTIYRYHFCNNWLFEYWKSRAYLSAVIAIAWKMGIHVYGTCATNEILNKVAFGMAIINFDDHNFFRYGWDPEYMALDPDAFLKDIDPEENNFGITSGLTLWLELEKEGLMDTGLRMYDPVEVRAKFEVRLASYRI